MNVGDKKQAALLSVVAVGAIGFLITQLGGALKGPNRVPNLISSLAASADRPANPTSDYPEVVTRDAFAHPKLESVSLKSKPVEPPPHLNTAESGRGTSGSGVNVDPLPSDPTWFTVHPESADHPSESADKATKGLEAARTSVKLTATMRTSKWTALMQVGTETYEVTQGQTLATGLRVIKIEEDSVTIDRGGKTETIAVGGEAKL